MRSKVSRLEELIGIGGIAEERGSALLEEEAALSGCVFCNSL